MEDANAGKLPQPESPVSSKDPDDNAVGAPKTSVDNGNTQPDIPETSKPASSQTSSDKLNDNLTEGVTSTSSVFVDGGLKDSQPKTVEDSTAGGSDDHSNRESTQDPSKVVASGRDNVNMLPPVATNTVVEPPKSVSNELQAQDSTHNPSNGHQSQDADLSGTEGVTSTSSVFVDGRLKDSQPKTVEDSTAGGSDDHSNRESTQVPSKVVASGSDNVNMLPPVATNTAVEPPKSVSNELQAQDSTHSPSNGHQSQDADLSGSFPVDSKEGDSKPSPEVQDSENDSRSLTVKVTKNGDHSPENAGSERNQIQQNAESSKFEHQVAELHPLILPHRRTTSSGSPMAFSPSNENRGLIDTTAPFESVKEAVSKFGGIVDWKEHKAHTVERRKLVEQELENVQEEMPEYRKRSEEAMADKNKVLKELDSTKRLVEELKLNLERAQKEEHQAKQDCDLAKLRVEEMEQGIADESSVAAKAQLEVAKARHAAAVSELKSIVDEVETMKSEYITLVAEKDAAVKKAEEAISASREVERTVEELTIELISTKESLESAHTAHMEMEEKRIGAAMAKDQDTHNWEKELRQAEEEVQRLHQQINSAKELKAKLDTASSLLLDLEAELAAYMEAKSKEETTEGHINGDLEQSEKKTRTDIQAAITSAKKELEEVKQNVDKATSEVNCLKVAAISLQTELEKEKSALATMKQREGMTSIAVSSLEAEVDKTRSEIAVVQMKEKEAKAMIAELPKELQLAAQVADEAKAVTEVVREEFRKAKEEVEQMKGAVSTMQSRLLATQKEIEAAKASETLALNAIKALQESEASQNSKGADSPTSMTLYPEEYYELSKRAHEAEVQANMRVAAAVSQIDVAKEYESKTLEKLEEVNKEMAAHKEALRMAMEKAEKSKEGKLNAEQELRRWRAEHEQQRNATESSQAMNNLKPSSESREEPKHSGPLHILTEATAKEEQTEAESSPEVKVGGKKKKKSFFPRFFMFLGRRKSSSKS